MGSSCRSIEDEDVNYAEQLARFIEKNLGYKEGYVDPVALRLFVQARWDRLSFLAHKIHEE